ncbi:hypothetical protein QBC40DRAFT_103139 [Triangularia verruculosa]|uniref:ML-like domain-containing protein n=1 Tax=Triangularia verruculosa TaxID=2587418 RepID=A0AAN6XF70_9PEZI|nr:hypothetical protein QBC40DRAFT_103139 [Triangularia verruculosa]
MREADVADFPVTHTPLSHPESPSERRGIQACGVQARGYHDRLRCSADLLPISSVAAMTGQSPSPDDLSSDTAGTKTHRALHDASHSQPAKPQPIRLPAVLLLLLSPLFHPAAAASVPFENCVPDIYRNSNPPKLQWEPIHVDASFEATDRHTLRVTLWGNVTGSYTATSLPPWDSPDWADPNKTDGKLLAVPDDNVPKPLYTTLKSKIEVLSYQPWSNSSDFCNDSLGNGKCPLAPVFSQETDFERQP